MEDDGRNEERKRWRMIVQEKVRRRQKGEERKEKSEGRREKECTRKGR